MRVFVPLFVNGIALLLVHLVPFTSLMLDLDFYLNLPQRERVVQMVLTGRLSPNVAHNAQLIALPAGYRYLSKGGGEIVVAQHGGTTMLFFYTFRGVTDNFSGFMYRSDATTPQHGDLGSEFREIEPLWDHWFWVAAS